MTARSLNKFSAFLAIRVAGNTVIQGHLKEKNTLNFSIKRCSQKSNFPLPFSKIKVFEFFLTCSRWLTSLHFLLLSNVYIHFFKEIILFSHVVSHQHLSAFPNIFGSLLKVQSWKSEKCFIYKKNILRLLHFKTPQFVSYLTEAFCLQTKKTIESAISEVVL